MIMAKKLLIKKAGINSEKAASEVLGMVMLLSIMMLVIGAILLVGVPMIESGKSRAGMDVSMNSFLSMQNDIEEVVRGPIWIVDPNNVSDMTGLGPSRESEFDLMGGILTVRPNPANLTYSITNKSVYNITMAPGNVTYDADDEALIYENGAVIRKYESPMALMVSGPLINIYDNGAGSTVVSIHAIWINGSLSSAGGDGKGSAQIRLRNYNQTIEPAGMTANSNVTILRIFSKYPETWMNFFDEKLKAAKLTQPDGYIMTGENPLIIRINGSSTNKFNPDIFLSVYESRIDVKVI